MIKKAEFAVKTIKKYAKENQIPARSTSDLSKFEEWLIVQLFLVKNLTIPVVVKSEAAVCPKCNGLRAVMVTDGEFMPCDECNQAN